MEPRDHDGDASAAIDPAAVLHAVDQLRTSLTTIFAYGQLLQRSQRDGAAVRTDLVERAATAIVNNAIVMIHDLTQLYDACDGAGAADQPAQRPRRSQNDWNHWPE